MLETSPVLPFSPTARHSLRGINKSVDSAPVNFTKSTVYGAGGTGDPISSLTISPDGNNLYAATLDGKLRRWTIDDISGNLTNLETFAPTQLAGRAIIGLTFNPNSP